MRHPSLRGRLRWLIVTMLVLVLLPLALYSFRRTTAEMEELSDGRLAQAAHTIGSLVQRTGVRALIGNEALLVPVQKKSTLRSLGEVRTDESEVGFQVFNGRGQLLLGTANLSTLPSSAMDRSEFLDLKKPITSGASLPLSINPMTW